MVFSSPVFLYCYLPLVLLGYFVMPLRVRIPYLFFTSVLFYAFGEGAYALLLLLSIVLNWLLALGIDRLSDPLQRKLLLAGSVLLNIGALIHFKYAGFLLSNLSGVARFFAVSSSAAAVHMPIGISFVTFEALSYVIDVYRGHTRARRNPIDVGLYVSFFPHLIAGPILRFDDIAPSLSSPRVSTSTFEAGVRRFITGLAKKLLLANVFGRVADDIFGMSAPSLGAACAWLGTIAYALQIYFDFSGYSDMAIGLGRLFGFELPRNFDLPYSARSIKDFWHRWHISLSTWFRDYLYIPLGGNRCSPLRSYFNLVVVFFFCGLWHGASWTFVIWGLYHGAFLVLERLRFGRLLEVMPRPLQHAYAVTVVLIGWVFFRAEGVEQAATFLRAMSGFGAASAGAARLVDHIDRELLVALLVGVPLATLPLTDWARRLGARLSSHGGAELGWRVAGSMAQLALLLACSIYLASGTHNPFIYFRF